jgi:hypothetical protein
MNVDIVVSKNIVAPEPLDDLMLRLVILCAALKHCMGNSKSMRFDKLSYLFDTAINRKPSISNISTGKHTWKVTRRFKQTLVRAYTVGYISLEKKNDGQVAIKLLDNGLLFLSGIESKLSFESYISYLRNSQMTDALFSSSELRCEINEH